MKSDVYSYIDEKPITGTADFISQAVANSVGYIEVGFENSLVVSKLEGVEVVGTLNSAGAGTINAVSAKLNDVGSITAIWTGVDVDWGAATVAWFSKQFSTPPSGGAWDRTKLNSLRVRYGYATDIAPVPNLQGLMLEVAFAGSAVIVPGAGYLWVETTDLHYIDASNQERVITGATTL